MSRVCPGVQLISDGNKCLSYDTSSGDKNVEASGCSESDRTSSCISPLASSLAPVCVVLESRVSVNTFQACESQLGGSQPSGSLAF